MWGWTNARWVTFFYSPTGDSESVKRFLGDDLARTVQCDGTSITTFLERAGGKRPGCWAHATAPPRRSRTRAATASRSRACASSRACSPSSATRRCAGDNAEQRRDATTASSVARSSTSCARGSIDRSAVTPPKTPLGKGLGYLHRQWRRLLLFLDDGNIEATNNRRERELRRLVLGRQNWLFTWLDEGGERTGDILSIVATCIAHDVNPRAYLHRVVHRIVHGWPQAKLRDLLPDTVCSPTTPSSTSATPTRCPCLPSRALSRPEPPAHLRDRAPACHEAISRAIPSPTSLVDGLPCFSTMGISKPPTIDESVSSGGWF